MDAPLDLSLLSAFVAVAEASSFSKAAALLGVTTATVSRTIAKLESIVGAELIHRTTRQVALSSAGEALYARTAPHVRSLRDAVQKLPERHDEPAGTLRLTAPVVLGVTFLSDVIARYVARYPEVRVEADFSNRKVDLVKEGFDLAIRGDGGVRKNSSMTIRTLTRTPLRFYAAPSYLARQGMPRTPGAKDHQWIVFGPLPRETKSEPEIEGRVVANDFLVLRETTRRGAGVGLLPVFLGEPLVATGDLVAVLPAFKSSLGGMVLLYPSTGRVPRKVAAFRDMLLAAIKGQTFE